MLGMNGSKGGKKERKILNRSKRRQGELKGKESEEKRKKRRRWEGEKGGARR